MLTKRLRADELPDNRVPHCVNSPAQADLDGRNVVDLHHDGVGLEQRVPDKMEGDRPGRAVRLVCAWRAECEQRLASLDKERMDSLVEARAHGIAGEFIHRMTLLRNDATSAVLLRLQGACKDACVRNAVNERARKRGDDEAGAPTWVGGEGGKGSARK